MTINVSERKKDEYFDVVPFPDTSVLVVRGISLCYETLASHSPTGDVETASLQNWLTWSKKSKEFQILTKRIRI